LRGKDRRERDFWADRFCDCLIQLLAEPLSTKRKNSAITVFLRAISWAKDIKKIISVIIAVKGGAISFQSF